MQEPTTLKKRVSDNSSAENPTKEITTETSGKSSKKATSSEGSRLSNIFRRLVCSSPSSPDDESEVMVIPKSGHK